MEKKVMSAYNQRPFEAMANRFIAKFEMDGRIRAAMEVIEAVHVNAEADERLHLAMSDIIYGAADVTAAVVLGVAK